MKVTPKSAEPPYGESVPGIVCPNCQTGMGLGGDVDGLPPSFEATCVNCGQTRIYQKAEIQSLLVVRKQ
jgi:hypothetical protein